MDNQLQKRKKELERELLKFDFSKRDTNIEMELSMLNDQIRVQEKESGLDDSEPIFEKRYETIRTKITHLSLEFLLVSLLSTLFVVMAGSIYQRETSHPQPKTQVGIIDVDKEIANHRIEKQQQIDQQKAMQSAVAIQQPVIDQKLLNDTQKSLNQQDVAESIKNLMNIGKAINGNLTQASKDLNQKQ